LIVLAGKFGVAGAGVTVAQLAQLVELPAAHEVVLPLALDHLLERLLAVAVVGLRVLLVEVCPVGGWIADELGHLGQQTGVVVVFGGHGSAPLKHGFQAIRQDHRAHRGGRRVSRRTSSA
jgi:hypothetical protein